MGINSEASKFAHEVFEAAKHPVPDFTNPVNTIQHKFERGNDGLQVVRTIMNGKDKVGEVSLPLDKWAEELYSIMPRPRLPRNLKPSAFSKLRCLVGTWLDPGVHDGF